ncbi:MAG: hypothetical protein A2664_04860 [Candidatus Taylorbacteria bacterium RIFCSPHIGHO2_01_FULL_46_22b]|uniref:Uncharacterized protein n=1 Tax=Candidatus Taylorbacteria bacterium RIFCSPHIGHO2_01_FULL_46_22b TaxID=1802301 RepID=A0A1G2M4K8_9BACT|nr:MAG: hypothetical protein A2664_04860 [Candidatus Taylorbacteria bacterium RIFCSPHIGHO2_01_FULL_46_22b]
MKQDNFWKIFWSTMLTVLVICTSALLWLKIGYLRLPEDTALAAAVGVRYDPARDPFRKEVVPEEMVIRKIPLLADYLYRESIPFGFEDWSWGVASKWRSSEQAFEGTFSLHAKFQEPWAGVRLSAPSVDITEYQSLSLSVYPDANITDLYLELYNIYGQPIERQSLSWYAHENKLTPNQWNALRIPISNLISSRENIKEITGFSISAGEKTGSAFIDAVQFTRTATVYPRWEMASSSAGGWGADIFASTTQVSLPYSLSRTESDLLNWRPIFGTFKNSEKGVLVGPTEKKTTGSMAVFGGGKEWGNYRVNMGIYWGMTSTFSILVRFADDANFVACAYSNYGSFIQMYQVKDGDSTLVAQSPLLAIRTLEPWKDASHGAEVRGNKVSCFLDGERIVSADLPTMPSRGTVGIETWSVNSDDYPHTLQSLTVSPL